ncbi:MAG: helix-turn-helix domain-containing protein [Anaerolineae bacterium]|nr:helix-turn-helix domain-containing protein [Anaerolineae bacterium]
MPGNWLSLSEVAELLGVHPSTVRNWADQGQLPVHRTQGGHRRFMRSELELWNKSQHASTADDTAVIIQSAMGYTRLQIGEGHLEAQEWYGKLNENARKAYRRGGRALMQGLMAFLNSDEDGGKAEAHALGYDYATLGRRHGLTIPEASQAFLFFRTVLLDSMMTVYESAAVNSAFAWGGMFRKINQFTDQILLALLETYQAFERGNGSHSPTEE